MSKRNRLVARPSAAALLFLLTGLGILGESLPATDSLRRMDAVFADWDKTTTPGMSLAVVKEGRILYTRGYGMASLELDVPNKPETVFDIGSISKQFTAAAIRILEHRGLLKLDDDIKAYIPELPRYERHVTIRQLVHHTSGIRDYEVLQSLAGEDTDQGWHTNQDLLELLVRQKGLDFVPGTKYQYSNSGYTLLAVIIERITGKSLGTFVKDNIFVPLGMVRTFILENNRIVVKNRARGYSLRDGLFVLDETLNESTGDGAVQSTVGDLALWDRNFYENRLDLPDFTTRMEEAGELADGRPASLSTQGQPGLYAFGLVLSTYRGLKTVSHSGAYVGFRAGYLRFPDQRLSIIICANIADVNPTDLWGRVADIVLEKEFKEPLEQETGLEAQPGLSPATQAALPSAALEVYAGDYFNEELPAAYELRVRDGSLCLVHKNAGSTDPLRREGDDLFSFGRIRIKFKRGDRNRILGFAIDSAQAKGLSFRKVRGVVVR